MIRYIIRMTKYERLPLPEEFVTRFKRYNAITYRQLMNLFNDYDDEDGRYISYSFDAVGVISENLLDYIDFESRTCDFNNAEFIKFLIELRKATGPQKIKKGDIGDVHYGLETQKEQEEYALHYLFADAQSAEFSLFIPYAREEVFTHFIPYKDEKGSLSFLSYRSFCINESSENKELAWEFIKFLTTRDSIQNVSNETFPVNKKTYQQQVPAVLTNLIERTRLQVAVEGETADIVNNAMRFFEQYKDMTMAQDIPVDVVVYEILHETLKRYYKGELSAPQAASEIQNKVSLYLME